MHIKITLLAFLLTLTAKAADLPKFHVCKGIRGASGLTLTVDVRQKSPAFGTYTITDQRGVVERQDTESSYFIFLTSGHLKFYDKHSRGTDGILLSVLRQRGKVSAYHHSRRMDFICE